MTKFCLRKEGFFYAHNIPEGFLSLEKFTQQNVMQLSNGKLSPKGELLFEAIWDEIIKVEDLKDDTYLPYKVLVKCDANIPEKPWYTSIDRYKKKYRGGYKVMMIDFRRNPKGKDTFKHVFELCRKDLGDSVLRFYKELEGFYAKMKDKLQIQ